MNGIGERRAETWGSDSNASELIDDRNGSWKDLGTSMSAISFGFAATAVLISMFLFMAIFEHLIKPRAPFFRSRHNNNNISVDSSLELGQQQQHANKKLEQSPVVGSQYSAGLSVLMPGQHYPTFIAQPAPLPCSREGIHWPSHDVDDASSFICNGWVSAHTTRHHISQNEMIEL